MRCNPEYINEDCPAWYEEDEVQEQINAYYDEQAELAMQAFDES